MPKKILPLRVLRMRLALNLAEGLERTFDLNYPGRKWDVDKATVYLEMMLPKTYDEALEDWEVMRREEQEIDKRPNKKGIFDDLRAALGLEKEKQLSIGETIKAATERILKLNKLKGKQ